MSSKTICPSTASFTDLLLNDQLLRALENLQYSTPTAIQSQMIPHIIQGRDVVGQAQTGTGKTAAFALPLLNKIKVGKKPKPQILVLAPTRELAIQVSESFVSYGTYLNHLKVIPIFGGQEYSTQLQQLRRGVHVVVGTPGRVMDHIRRQSLDLSGITSLVLDEADEMLKMGFIDDVEWILNQTPEEKQVALFSATMPDSIRAIAKQHLNNPIEITVKSKTVTASNIDQKYLLTSGRHSKKDAITKILEAETFEGMLIFVRTKIQTIEIAEHLVSLGHKCGPLNGDIPQSQRLRMVEQLKNGKLDIVVATDVAARGLDVERISHVINYDTPYDTEAYIHRIGRTGRAGRNGKAIIFLNPQEKRLLKTIERHTGSRIALMKLPTAKEINARRIEEFSRRITKTLCGDCSIFENLVAEYCKENNADAHHVAAAVIKMLHLEKPLMVEEKNTPAKKATENTSRSERKNQKNTEALAPIPKTTDNKPEQGMDRYRIEVGHQHGVTPKNIVGAIANEADIDSEYIGRISIFEEYSTVDLPYGMPRHILRILQKARIYDRMMQMKRENQLGLDQPTNIGRKKKNRNKTKNNKRSALTNLSH